jgi:hypothetical protein
MAKSEIQTFTNKTARIAFAMMTKQDSCRFAAAAV